MAGRLAQSLGDDLAGVQALGLTHVFPAAERVASARVERLTDSGLTRPRAESIRAFARAYLDGTVVLDGSRTLDDTLVPLMALPGIGAWSATMIAMRATSSLDAFPADDLGLRKAAGALLGGAGPMNAAELADRAEAWRPYRAVAAMYLWSSMAG
jgi:3-methyladenine DNA glycosylase/8-oxoguanine DNA glycosylase